MPRVTVILLSWNQARFCADGVAAIAAQRFRDFEVVAIDNGSVDGSAELIAASAARLGLPVRQVVNAENLGICAALNQGLAMVSDSDYVVPFAVDDVMLPSRLGLQVDFLDSISPDAAAVTGDALLIDEAGVPMRDGSGNELIYRAKFSDDSAQQRLDLINGLHPVAPAVMIRRDALIAIGGYDESAPFEDVDCWLRLVFLQGMHLRRQPGVVVHYRRHESNASSPRNAALLHRGIIHALTTIKSQAHLSGSEREAIERRLGTAGAALDRIALADGLRSGGVARSVAAKVARNSEQPTLARLKACAAIPSPALYRRAQRRVRVVRSVTSGASRSVEE